MIFSQQDQLVTHSNCLDGALCAVVFLLFGGNKKNIYFSSPSHEKVDPLVMDIQKKRIGKLYLADISVSEKVAQELDKYKDIHLFDHHKSAIPLARFSWCHVDKENTMCGSKLFFQQCCRPRDGNHSLALEPLLDAVDDRDRWQHKNKYSSDLSELFSLLGQENFIERCLCNLNPELTHDERVAVEFETARKQIYIEQLKPVIQEVDGHSVGFVYCDRYISDAGHAMCLKYDLACCVLIGTVSISMRAPNSSPLDMSVIAKSFGGGGHKGAAGFQLSALLGKSLLDQVKEAFKLP